MGISFDWRRLRLVVHDKVEGLRRSPKAMIADAAKRIDAVGGGYRLSEESLSLRFFGKRPRSWTGAIRDGAVVVAPVAGRIEVRVEADLATSFTFWVVILGLGWLFRQIEFRVALFGVGFAWALSSLWIYVGLRAIARAAVTGKVF